MPDWKKLITERIGSLNLPPTAQQSIIAELAAHLEETYEASREQGLNEIEAIERSLQEVRDWRVLAENIQRAKSEESRMNTRTKSLWLPGMLSLLGASVFLMALQHLGVQPRLFWIGHVAMSFYWPWIAGLPVFGALGAYLSQRAQGTVRSRLAAAASPALVLLGTMCLILPWAMAIDGFSVARLGYFAVGVVNWVALPAVALLVGALPFLREPAMPQQSQPRGLRSEA